MSKKTRPILLIGNTGQVGWELQRSLMPLGEVVAVGRGSSPSSVDLSNPDSIRALVRDLRPALIINATFTAVDRAKEETAPGILAEEAKTLRAGLVHYSTDYVFDGRATTPYLEVHPTNPVNVYGQTAIGFWTATTELGKCAGTVRPGTACG